MATLSKIKGKPFVARDKSSLESDLMKSLTVSDSLKS